MDAQKLLETLQELTGDELDLFKFHMHDLPENILGGLKPIREGALEEANTRQKVVKLIMKKYPNDAQDIVMSVLRKITRNDLANDLENILRASGVERPQSIQATGVDTPSKSADSGEPKKNGYRAAAVCLGLMCFLLSAGIIGLVIHNNNLVKHLDQLQTRHNVTEQNVTCETRLEGLQTSYINAIQDKAKSQTSVDELQTKNTNCQTSVDGLQTKNANCQTSVNELQTRYNNLIKDDLIKKRLCEITGWQTFGSSCYYISTGILLKTWEESRQYCRDRQSDLMVINIKEKQDFVKRVNQRVWLGLTDRETEGTFVWVDGTPLTTPTFWDAGEPNNADGPEDCVEFFPSKSGRWNDRSCTERNQWICEI